MPGISPQEVRHVAALAKLDLPEDELARVGVELNRILEYFAQLQAINTDNVPVTSHAIPMINVYRDDKVQESLDPEEAVAGAPDGVDEFFRVPRMVDE